VNPAAFYRTQPTPRREPDGRFVVNWRELTRLARHWDASGIFPEAEYEEYCRTVGNTPTTPTPEDWK
jgi:hypothetical protein